MLSSFVFFLTLIWMSWGGGDSFPLYYDMIPRISLFFLLSILVGIIDAKVSVSNLLLNLSSKPCILQKLRHIEKCPQFDRTDYICRER